MSVDQKQVAGEGKGTQYVLTLGNWQKWLLYCSEDVEFTKSGDKMVASRPITGFVRVAFLPIQSPNAFSTLMNFVNKYPTGASLSFSFPPASHTGVVEYRYRTQGTGRLLMLSLPHHREVLTFPSQSDEEDESSEEVDSSLSPYLCIKGQMKAVIGEVWKLTYPLPKVIISLIIIRTCS